MLTNLFVYGTLKRGFGNNRLLPPETFVGKATSVDEKYVMWGRGFPFLAEGLPSGAEHFPITNDLARVTGEIYAVPKNVLDRCDGLEGHPDWYRRFERRFILTELSQNETPFEIGEEVTAWVYLQKPRDHIDTLVRPVNGVIEWRHFEC